LLLIGRLPNFTYIRGAILAAAAHGWLLDLGRSQYLRVRANAEGAENFPAMVFLSAETGQTEELVEQAERLFGDAQLPR
jgi:hypothetical protein